MQRGANAARAYRRWEIGTYSCAWRIVQDGVVLCGSQDGGPAELDATLQGIELGRFVSLQELNALDLRIELNNGIVVDFLAAFSDDDECIHIFCPENLSIEFSLSNGWRIGPSNEPWRRDVQDSFR